MRRLLVCLILLAALPAPAAAAERSYLTGYRVYDGGSYIKHFVTVCSPRPATVRLISYIVPEEGARQYRTYTTGGHQPRSCLRWEQGRRDIFANGYWYGRLTVVLNGTVVLRTAFRRFYIS
jgi:hypothetical protein